MEAVTKDYNDLVFAIDIGSENVKALVSGDAPAWLIYALVAMTTLSMFTFLRGYHHDKQA